MKFAFVWKVFSCLFSKFGFGFGVNDFVFLVGLLQEFLFWAVDSALFFSFLAD